MSFLRSALILSLFYDWGPTTKMAYGSVIARDWLHAHKIITTFSQCVEREWPEWEREKEELRRRVWCGVKPTISIRNLAPPAGRSFRLSSEISQYLLNEWAQNLKHPNNYQMLECTDMYGWETINASDFGDRLTFHVTPSSAQNVVWFITKWMTFNQWHQPQLHLVSCANYHRANMLNWSRLHTPSAC